MVLLLFAAAETALRVFRLCPPPEFFVETKDDQGQVWTKYKAGIKPRFPKIKKPGTFRIMVFGESSVMGYPFHPRASFPAMLELALNKSDPQKTIEVLNLGASGITSLQIYYCLRQALKYQPDLVVIYAGQNEFFQASLFADWKHPFLDRSLDVLRLHSRIYQLFRKTDQLLTMLPAAVGTRQELAEKLNFNLEKLPMENRPMSQQFYENRIQSFQYHMNRILELLSRRKIPTVLCTVAVNLKDWPPEWLPFPPQLSASQSELLKNQLYQASLDIADGQLQKANELLEKSRQLAQDYAMYYFVKAWMEYKQGEMESSRRDFLLARQFDNSRHRAPPEINPKLRELAVKYQAVLADIDSRFMKISRPVPGFDWFIDHVHPNLPGQRLIAEELYQILVLNRLVPLNKPLPECPAVDEFKKAFKLDDNFLDEVNLHMAIYYLLQRRLPEREKHTINFLSQDFARHSDHVLSGICLASILLAQYQEAAAVEFLGTLFLKNNPSQVRKTLEHYFFPKIIMQGNFLLFHLNLDPALPPLRGIMLVRAETKTAMQKSSLPLEQYQWIFQYHPAENRFENITAAFREKYQAGKNLCNRPQKARYDIVAFYKQKPGIFRVNDSSLKASGNYLEMQMTGKDPWFAFPLEIDPWATTNIELQLALTPDDPKIHQAELNLYWATTEPPEFSETQKLSLPIRADGKPHPLLIDLMGNINWLSSGKVSALRLDPADFKGRAQIRGFKVTLCAL